ncbi:hypothetical protein DMX03_19760 [Pseudomonas koreensis]|nr:hypothetical protein DMX03_19760 [Pseudomonas koreensis]
MIMRTNTSTRVLRCSLVGATLLAKCAVSVSTFTTDPPLSRAGSLPQGICAKRIKKARHPERMARLFLLADSWLSCRRQSSARSTPSRCGCCCAAPDHYPPRQFA